MVWENKRFITLEGAGTSDGISIGRAVPVENALPVVKREYVEDTAAELLRLQAAQETCIHEIELLAEETEVKAGRQVAAIVRSHKALLADPALNGEITRMISTEKCSCEWAVETVCVRYRQMFEMMEDELMRQRAADLDDIRIRLLMALTGSTARGLSLLPEGSVIVAKELTPSMTASMDSSKVVGILTEVGGVNSHAAILARALEIPAVSGVPDVMDHIKTGEEIIVDGFGGKAYVSPDGPTRERFERRRDELQQEKQALFEYRNRRAVTRDGREVSLMINMERPGDIANMQRVGACGVGLFRTEFLFMNRETAPDEEEQYRIYSRVAGSMGGRPLTIRTLDIGGDKNAPCVKIPEEENPFLGYRAIRLCLDRREELLLPQLRAILRAGVNKNVRIMLPMITSLEEFRAGKAAVEEAGRALEAENIPCAGKIPVGMMVETPAAALMADVFAREADFFSIGTNDLIQYTMAVDRGNELVASLYSPFQPAVLRSIRRIAAEGGRAGIPVGMCGEAASDPRLAPLFLAFGITELSMAPAQVLRMKEAITRLDLGKAEECIKRVLSAATAAEVLKIMEECW